MSGWDWNARVMQVIRTELTVRGGTPVEQARGDVARRIVQYWSLDGNLLAEVDPCFKGAGGSAQGAAVLPRAKED